MTNEESRLQFEAAEDGNKSNSSFEKLRAKLKNFTVKDKQGELIGVVEDLILEPNRQINFVMSQDYGEQSRSVSFNSKLVQKVDRLNQSVILDINKADYPQHIAIETLGMETPENLDKSVTPAYEAVDEEITNIDLYTSTPPAGNTDATENNDIDIASMFDMTADANQEDTMLGSGVEFSATPMASGDIDVNPMFDTTSINTQQDIDLDREVEFSTMSTASDDIDITSMFDIAADDIPEEITLDSDVDLLATPNDAVTDIESQIDTTAIASENLVEEELIRLLGERVTVERGKRKVGEVIVRKEIETRMIQVPVRREKLIIEQVGSENKQLAEIDLGLAEISGIEADETQFTPTLSGMGSLDNALTVRGEFNSPKIASLLLNAIALERRQGCKTIRVEIVVDDAERQKTYQEWIDRASGSKNAANL